MWCGSTKTTNSATRPWGWVATPTTPTIPTFPPLPHTLRLRIQSGGLSCRATRAMNFAAFYGHTLLRTVFPAKSIPSPPPPLLSLRLSRPPSPAPPASPLPAAFVAAPLLLRPSPPCYRPSAAPLPVAVLRAAMPMIPGAWGEALEYGKPLAMITLTQRTSAARCLPPAVPPSLPAAFVAVPLLPRPSPPFCRPSAAPLPMAVLGAAILPGTCREPLGHGEPLAKSTFVQRTPAACCSPLAVPPSLPAAFVAVPLLPRPSPPFCRPYAAPPPMAVLGAAILPGACREPLVHGEPLAMTTFAQRTPAARCLLPAVPPSLPAALVAAPLPRRPSLPSRRPSAAPLPMAVLGAAILPGACREPLVHGEPLAKSTFVQRTSAACCSPLAVPLTLTPSTPALPPPPRATRLWARSGEPNGRAAAATSRAPGRRPRLRGFYSLESLPIPPSRPPPPHRRRVDAAPRHAALGRRWHRRAEDHQQPLRWDDHRLLLSVPHLLCPLPSCFSLCLPPLPPPYWLAVD
jgi:hypothetical protein